MWEATGDALGDRPALVDDARTRTYAELDDEAARVAGGRRGVPAGPGARVIRW
jgi:non-ribosomal peptide synthetase component E (peptide arylation enzyme)